MVFKAFFNEKRLKTYKCNRLLGLGYRQYHHRCGECQLFGAQREADWWIVRRRYDPDIKDSYQEEITARLGILPFTGASAQGIFLFSC